MTEIIRTIGRPAMEFFAEQERLSWDEACRKCDPFNRAQARLWGQFFTRDGTAVTAVGVAVCNSHFSQLYRAWLRGDLVEIDGREIVTLSPTRRPL
jgi:hypothetical protein